MKACVVNNQHGPIIKSFSKKRTDIYKCPDCGCLMADIDYNQNQYEQSNYYTLLKKTKEAIHKEWGLRWNYILKKLQSQGNFKTLLDVGAGNGYFVYLAKNFYEAEGLEISNEQIKFAYNVLGICLLNERIEDHNGQYDIITLFNVLEHIPEPKMFLMSTLKRLNPHGILVLTTPNPECIQVKTKGIQNWTMVDPPHHLNIFTKEALIQMLHACNLDIKEYQTLSTKVRRYRSYTIRYLLFTLLRILKLGGDHFIIAKTVL